MSNPFVIKRSERWLAILSFVWFAILNALQIYSHFSRYLITNGGFWTTFSRIFRLSGYDAWSCVFLSNGQVYFETSRHPLYLTLLYPLYWLNQLIMQVFNVNAAIFIMAVLLVVCSVYSFIFFYRTMSEVLGLKASMSLVLTVMLFSLAHVLVPIVSPDHFAFSLMLLTLTLWLSGNAIKEKKSLSALTSGLLLFFTAGMSLTNGAKTLLAALFANKKGLFNARFLLTAVFFPLLLILGIQQVEYLTIEKPRYEQRVADNNRMEKKKRGDIKRQKRMEEHVKWITEHNGKALGDGPISKLIDVSTPRPKTLWDNFFGESLQLHQHALLKDVQQDRPVFVSYSWIINYVVEALLILLLIAGIIIGFRYAFLRMVLCWFALDFTLNIILGFAINEVYIMTSGWAFIIPISIGYILKRINRQYKPYIAGAVIVITAFLFVYNNSLLVSHLLAS